MKSALLSLFRTIFARKYAQWLWEKLFRLSLLGMNISAEPDIEGSGETQALRKYVTLLAQAGIGEPVLFDVGANKGEYTLAFCQFAPKGRAYCFEPAETTLQDLRRTTANIVGITLVPQGISDSVQEATLFSDANSSGLASVLPPPDFHYIKLPHEETISLTTLDAFAAEHQIDRINILKLDIEGLEWKALQGATQLLEKDSIDIIQFEFGYANINAQTYFRDFFRLLAPSFRLFRIVKDGLREIEHYSEIHEQFLLTNFCAIRRGIAVR